MSDNHFRSSTNGDDIGDNFYVFDIRYQKNLESAQPKNVKIKFSANIPAGMYSYALPLTNRMVSSSNGQRHFDLI